jgi:hypothetical protein
MPDLDALVVLDADVDDQGNAAFAMGTLGTATHVQFGTGARVPLPVPLHNCAVGLRDRDRALVRGWERPPFSEGHAYEVANDGTVGRSLLPIQYCSDFLCTDDRVVLTHIDDSMARGIAHADRAIAIFDWEGAFLWGWKGSFDLPDLYDCEGATRLGSNIIGVFPNHDFPLVVLDAGTCQPVEIYYPTPTELHGARSIARRGDVWCFLSPYEDRESALVWRPGSGKPTMIDALPWPHHFRGLPNGQFISVAEGRVEILQVTAADVDAAE